MDLTQGQTSYRQGWSMKSLFVTNRFLDLHFSSNTRLEGQAQHNPILLAPDSIASMLSQYPVFSFSAMHLLKANEGMPKETGGGRGRQI